MRAMHRVVLLAAFAAFASTLTACSNFDPDKLDVFGLNEKKKLPGERKELFPGGVPGVSQGIPPEYVKGSQPPPEAAQAPVTEPGSPAAAAAEPDKKRPRRSRATAKTEAQAEVAYSFATCSAERATRRRPTAIRPVAAAEPAAGAAAGPGALAGAGAGSKQCRQPLAVIAAQHRRALIGTGHVWE